jgi:hypothetical protein
MAGLSGYGKTLRPGDELRRTLYHHHADGQSEFEGSGYPLAVGRQRRTGAFPPRQGYASLLIPEQPHTAERRVSGEVLRPGISLDSSFDKKPLVILTRLIGFDMNRSLWSLGQWCRVRHRLRPWNWLSSSSQPVNRLGILLSPLGVASDER